MSGRFTRAWSARQWFDGPFALLGLALTVLGSTFFVFVYSIGAPVVPFGGLVIAAFGVWIGLLRPLWRNPDTQAPISPEAPPT
ncbi:MAG: hypothetical protein QF464_14130, partial [Myxococcota bacterium]|nr:hypothetical protein [Myxococcota bacterium]